MNIFFIWQKKREFKRTKKFNFWKICYHFLQIKILLNYSLKDSVLSYTNRIFLFFAFQMSHSRVIVLTAKERRVGTSAVKNLHFSIFFHKKINFSTLKCVLNDGIFIIRIKWIQFQEINHSLLPIPTTYNSLKSLKITWSIFKNVWFLLNFWVPF